jgi:elongation of very long chain fatty acids protein 4
LQNYSATPCNAFDHENPVMGNLMYIFYLSKVLDFCDTFFIVMGKKWKQLSVLHVYHHVLSGRPTPTVQRES